LVYGNERNSDTKYMFIYYLYDSSGLCLATYMTFLSVRKSPQSVVSVKLIRPILRDGPESRMHAPCNADANDDAIRHRVHDVDDFLHARHE